MKKSALLLLAFSFISSVHAQPPQGINYQAVVRDGSGQPVRNQGVRVQISILRDSATGVQVYLETHRPTTNNFGNINLVIGRGTTTGNFGSVNWSLGPYFINLGVDITGGSTYTDLGTSQLLSVPYALYAGKAGGYRGRSPVYVDTGFNIGLNAATSPNDLMTWDGNNWVARQPPVPTRQQVANLNLDNRQPYLALNYIIALQGVFPSRNVVDPFIADIVLFAGNFPPRGWAFCDGQLLSIAQNSALFSLIGTIYGGDGQVTFALPDLRGRVPIGPRQGSGLSNYVEGEIGGTELIR